MIKRLKYSKIDLVERTGALMLVTFLDDDGNMYQWAPKWSDVEQVFLKQINVERFNKPESAFLNKFAKTAQNVVEGAQRITSASKHRGTFKRYSDGELLVESDWLKPGFEVTKDFLDNWLGQNVEAFVINDMVIRIRHFWFDDDANEERYDEYPPTEQEAEDIPF